MTFRVLALPFLLLAGAAPALGEGSEPSIACTLQVSPESGLPLQEGHVVSVQIAAVSQLPIDALEVNGVRLAIRRPKSLLLRNESVRLSAGTHTMKVRVGASDLTADCETEPFTVEPTPVCGEGQEMVISQEPFTTTKVVIQHVQVTMMREVTQCVDVSR